MKRTRWFTKLEKAKLAREKLEGLTQGLAQTDQVIKEAQTEISELKAQNVDLGRKAAMKGLVDWRFIEEAEVPPGPWSVSGQKTQSLYLREANRERSNLRSAEY
jgi:hypothetical protein